MITLKIDGRELQVIEGATVLEAAIQAGIKIPTLCNLKDINNIGACRMCLCEDGRSHKLFASCVMPVSEGMEVPLEKVYGVATVYAQFSLAPKGEYNVSVCLGTACYVKGAQAIFDGISEKLGIGVDECTADGKFSLTACRCIGACGLGPVLTVNDEVYGKLTPDDVPKILEKYGA